MRKMLPFRPTEKNRKFLEDYKAKVGISFSETINRAIELFSKTSGLVAAHGKTPRSVGV